MLIKSFAPRRLPVKLEIDLSGLVCFERSRSFKNFPHRRETSCHLKARAALFRQLEPERKTLILKASAPPEKRLTHTRAASSMSLVGDTFYLDEFAFRQFEGGHAAQLDVSKEDFVHTVHKLYHEARSDPTAISSSRP